MEYISSHSKEIAVCSECAVNIGHKYGTGFVFDFAWFDGAGRRFGICEDCSKVLEKMIYAT